MLLIRLLLMLALARPDIGPVYGHTTAYGAGQVVGTVTGAVAGMAVVPPAIQGETARSRLAHHFPHRRTIGMRGRTQKPRGHRQDGHRVAGHVEELNAVAVLASGHDMVFHHRADVAGPQVLLRDIRRQDYIGEKLKRHASPRVQIIPEFLRRDNGVLGVGDAHRSPLQHDYTLFAERWNVGADRFARVAALKPLREDQASDTINPLNNWLSVPDIGPVYGHTTAYGAGQVVGTVAGVVAGMAAGNVAAGGCGAAALAAKAYTTIDTVAGMAAAGQHLYDGEAGFGDLLAAAPVLTFGAQRLRGVTNQCFAEGTEVLVGSAGNPGVFSEKKIEDVQVGDEVWTRPDDDADAPLELKHVTAVEQHTAYDLQKVSVRSGDGNVEILDVTDEHPFFTQDRGWIAAADLYIGELLVSPDGTVRIVVANADDQRPEGVTVYNFTVEGDHTYFVADGEGEESWTWVHNTCISINAPAGRTRELAAFKELSAANPGSVIQRESYLRDARGRRLIDPLTGEARRIDFAVIERGRLASLVEATSETASKVLQGAKEARIRALGRAFIRDRASGRLLDASEIMTQLKRMP